MMFSIVLPFLLYVDMYVFITTIILLGTKGEMNRLEDQFVAGSWAPPFVTPRSPPKKKRKTLKKTRPTAENKEKGNQTKRKES